ncbi:MAG: hypothetical protein KDA80_01210 [Planctomycetaceae bacterium]|nr:hypothetical protein [Planctomycetaceae bacterium]
MTPYEIFGLIVGVIVLLATAWWLSLSLRRHRHHVWHDFAKRWNFSLQETPEIWELTGTYGNRRVRITTAAGSSDAEGGVAEVLVAVELHNVPAELIAEGTPGSLGTVVQAIDSEANTISLGNDDFDRAVRCVCPHEAEALHYWTSNRQWVLLDLLEKVPTDRLAVRERGLEAEFRSVLSDLEQLEQIVGMLTSTAPQLDGGPIVAKVED